MTQKTKYLWALALIGLAIFFPHLDVVEINIMEARNFITAREMLQFDHWIHTTMNLEPRYEKPPLPTWLTALSASLFGMTNLYALRLPAALAALLLLFSFYQLGIKVLRNQTQSLTASLILATSFYIIFAGRNGQWDIFAHSFMTVAILHLFQAFEADTSKWKHWLLAGLFLGLSFMSKGPVSPYALLLPFLIGYGFTFNYRSFHKKWGALVGSLLLFAIIGFTWGIYIYFTDVSSAEMIADKETKAWVNRSVKPFYHYWSFFSQSGAWTFFSFIALLYPFMIKRVDDKKAYRFSLFWTLSAVVLLSLIPEKKERYLLPVLIPLAMNTSFYFNYLFTKAQALTRADHMITRFGMGLIALIGFVFPVGLYIFFDRELEGYMTSFILSSISLLGLSGAISYFLTKKAYDKGFYSIILFLCSIMVFAFPLAGKLKDNPDYYPMSELRSIQGMEEIGLYSLSKTIPSPEMIFDLGEAIQRVPDPGSLPQEEPFALLVVDSIPSGVEQLYNSEFKAKFDLNNRAKGKNGHKARKTMKLYLLEKK